MPIYAYCRATKSLSLEEQHHLIVEQVMRNGWTIDTTLIEVNSRIIPLRGRKQGKRLLRLLQTGDTIIAAQFFSLFGSQPEALEIIRDFQQRRISLWVLDVGGEFNNDKLVGFPLRVLFRARELEGFSASRIRAGNAKLRAEGKYQGGTRPFGWEVGADRTIIPDPAEQTAIGRIRELHAEGRSYRDIANVLRDAGIKISHPTIWRISSEPSKTT